MRDSLQHVPIIRRYSGSANRQLMLVRMREFTRLPGAIYIGIA
jgi:hypothetical protein